jgi:hypothetical protein
MNVHDLVGLVNVTTSKKAKIWLNIASLVGIFVFFVLFLFISKWFGASNLFTDPDRAFSHPILSLIAYIVIAVALVFIHQLVQAAFLKLFNLDGQVQFGAAGGMFYAASHGSYYTKLEYVVICLAPLVLISAVLLGIFIKSGNIIWIMLAALHAGQSVTDLYLAWKTITAPKGTVVEDIPVGLAIWKDPR